MRPALIVHGGAGVVAPDDAGACAAGCAAATRAGWQVLDGGGTALDAVTAAVVVLEDDSAFNAGVGSVLTSAGTVETDASIMDGATLAAGACAVVSEVRNPIGLARAVMATGDIVFLVGDAAIALARERGLALCPPAFLITERQRRRWQQRATETANTGNTVGAVAVDRAGHVAAATSTGGMFCKRPGRIGDSAVIGAGTYADDRLGAASATGVGEAIIRIGLARMAVDLLADGRAPMAAAHEAVTRLMARVPAPVGVIVIDPLGRIGHARSSSHMPLAFRNGALDDLAAC
ncbi:MAG: isoaspartyl peptidase/L-asparaginase [Deltaproteobacteria bacterium]|nr:isoaspartyl peptidase/L-asparaginase [Deltaproteobacteria bacterium]MBI3388056.1 isoaspartyl peptidase/L-asparaginase [Deltaproteobacteria bacterium]